MKKFFMVISLLSLSAMGMENKWTPENTKRILQELNKKNLITPQMLFNGSKEVFDYMNALEKGVKNLNDLPFCDQAKKDVNQAIEFLKEFNGNKNLVQKIFGIQEEVEQKVNPALVKEAVQKSGIHYLGIAEFFKAFGQNPVNLVAQGQDPQDTVKKTSEQLFRFLFQKLGDTARKTEAENAIEYFTKDGYAPIAFALAFYKVTYDAKLAVTLGNALRRMLLDKHLVAREKVCNPINEAFVQNNYDPQGYEDDFANDLSNNDNYELQTIQKVRKRIGQNNQIQKNTDIAPLVIEMNQALKTLKQQGQTFQEILLQNWQNFSSSILVFTLIDHEHIKEYPAVHKFLNQDLNKIEQTFTIIIEELRNMWGQEKNIQLQARKNMFQSSFFNLKNNLKK